MNALTKREYTEWLNELPVPYEDSKSGGGRIPDHAKYGDWIRRNDPIAFNVGYQEAVRDHEWAAGRNRTAPLGVLSTPAATATPDATRTL